jgi:hypothetical protein
MSECKCDLVTEQAPQWWIDLPGLHHLTGCPKRPATPTETEPETDQPKES